ncbi:MAG: glycosyltransferase, partial [Candidatus Binataceae bacterium]
LEAMACGAPVVSSTSSSLPEVGGDAALYADPHDAGEFAAQVVRVLHDRALRARMVEEGMRRARQFSWRRAAKETLAVYQEVCGVAPVRRWNLNGSGR